MPQSKTIKFFISSTFKDFLKERNALQNFVFPRLKQLCSEKGFSFQPVDLRWGVTEETSEDNKTMEYCLNEVRRSSSDPKPNLLILFGQRYGWGPLPSFLTQNEWEYITSKCSTEEETKLDNWYIQDLNDVEEKYFLKDKKGLERKEWEAIEKELKDIIQTATKDKNDHKDFSRFHTSATEQEIQDALEKQYQANSENTIVYFREFSEGKDKDLIEESKEAQENITKLKEYLVEQELTSIANPSINVEKYNTLKDEYFPEDKDTYSYPKDIPDYLKDFCEKVYSEFEAKIQKEIESFDEKSPLEVELEQQNIFLEKKYKKEQDNLINDIIGRDDEVKEIKDFVTKSDEQFYLLYGKSGSGKTSVMAKAISELKDSGETIIYRFIGITAHATSPRDTYEHIYWEILGKDIEKKPDTEPEDEKFYKQFQQALINYTKEKKLTLFIDAVDQFNSFDSMQIFLNYTPKNIKVVFSCLYDEQKTDNQDYTTYFNTLAHIEDKKELEPLKQEANSEILNSWLEKAERKLSKNQLTLVEKYTEEKTPLYLRLVYEIVRKWKSTDDLDDNEKELANSEEKLIVKFFDNVVEKHYVKRDLLELSLGLISASNAGLSETELIDVLSNEKEILKLYEIEGSSYPDLEKLPESIFSKMYFHIQDIFTEKLIDGEMLIKPYHRIVEEVIKKIYFDKLIHHDKLADFFYKKVLISSNPRNFKESIHSYHQLKNRDKINEIFNLIEKLNFNEDFYIWGETYFFTQHNKMLHKYIENVIRKVKLSDEILQRELQITQKIMDVFNNEKNPNFIIKDIQQDASFPTQQRGKRLIIDLLITILEVSTQKEIKLGFEFKKNTAITSERKKEFFHRLIMQAQEYEKINNSVFYNIVLCDKVFFMKMDSDKSRFFSLLKFSNHC